MNKIKMEVKIKQVNPNFTFIATNGEVETSIVAKPDLSENTQGFRPMELMLSSLGSCMSIDVLLILQKQKQEVKNYEVTVTGKRADSVPSIFTHIELHFQLEGKVDESKLERAINLSKDKYCPAFAIISKTANIQYKYTVSNGE